ncbi:phosphopentomutase [Dethiobacter alkaliphilus]|uniref:phosphopentomutase n=1 Tax=Dethiobacter alkaliphilus TaxID=427926 RepID=UPI002226EB8D|nr:phosphopentomutase [Dethiobacter alkaliphilus]MCW3490241.1 phosphopentomutase [Dethiobacter alkaliphilus]
MTIKRVLCIVLDSLGVGELPDASFYGDAGSNTLAHIAKATGGLNVPRLQSFGLGCLTAVEGVPCISDPAGAYGKMAERSKGKDTTTGHWEMTGIILDNPFPTYESGFPPEIIEPFEAAIGRKVLGNIKASGTEIIQSLGEQHMETGRPIVYTSADSVFQIAAHEDVVPVELLYKWCAAARNLLRDEHAVGRVIARPFTGKPGDFQRTPNRKDYSVKPPNPTLLDKLVEAGHEVVGIGKIPDIFAGQGITTSLHTKNNDDGMAKLQEAMERFATGLLFINLVDFDMVFGHRNDATGYAQALERFDSQLGDVLDRMRADDVLFIVADHGCDPTFPHTDHTREYVPLLAYGKQVEPKNLGIRPTFADLGATVAALLGAEPLEAGTDFSAEIGLKKR